MILTYRVLTIFLYPFLILYTYFRKFFKKEDPIRFKEKIFISHFKASEKGKSKLIWFHAASIGEFKSIIPIIEQLNINNDNLKFLITTTTVSSGNLSKIELKKISNWKPDRIFLVDSEIWPNLILSAKKNKIPIALINARLTSKSFNRWMFFPGITKKVFQIFNLCLCSNSKTKQKLEMLDLKNVYYEGNIKLIENVNEKNIKNVNEQILLNRRFWFAASTHKEENTFCINTHVQIKEKFKDILTIIAPRHLERVKELEYLCK